jgi:hypothetical protein
MLTECEAVEGRQMRLQVFWACLPWATTREGKAWREESESRAKVQFLCPEGTLFLVDEELK